MLTPLATIASPKSKRGVKRARGAEKSKPEPGCGDALWTPLTQSEVACHATEVSAPSPSYVVTPVPAGLPPASTDLPRVTPISDPVVVWTFERVVELLEGQPAREEVHGTHGADITGVFM